MSELALKSEKNKSASEIRSSIQKLEATMLAMPKAQDGQMGQIEVPIDHFFAPGLYLRQMSMPKDSAVSGKIHKTEHYCILSKGDVSVVTEDGLKRYRAPAVIHAMPGAKRVLYAHEDTVWVNVHHNPKDERNIDKIDDFFVVDTFDEYLSFREQKLVEGKE